MSGQVLTILVSARLSWLVYKVLIEHEVCIEQSIILNLSLLLSALSLSLPIHLHLYVFYVYRTVLLLNCILYVYATHFRIMYSFTWY